MNELNIYIYNKYNYCYYFVGRISNNKQPTSRISYKKFQLIRILPIDEDDVLDVEALSEEPGVQIWLPIRMNKTADLVLPPSVARDAKRFLSQREIDFVVLSSDLEVYVHFNNKRLHYIYVSVKRWFNIFVICIIVITREASVNKILNYHLLVKNQN